MQLIPIFHATHNNVLPYLGVSHSKSFSTAIPIRVSHTRNPSLPPFSIQVSLTRNPSLPPFPSRRLTPGILLRRHSHPGVSYPESFSTAIPPGCLISGILLCRHSIRVSHHLESFSAAIPPGCLISEILLRRHSIRVSHHLESFSAAIPPGCLTSEILSADVPPSPDVSHLEFYPADVPPPSSSLEHFL